MTPAESCARNRATRDEFDRPKDKDVLTFDAALHEYRVDGKIVPHVTGIISSLMDFSAVPQDVLEAGRQRGSAVHALTQAEDEGTLEEWQVLPCLAPYLAAYRAFRAEAHPRWTGIEERVWHPVHRYSGTLDRRGYLCDYRVGERSELVFLDIKTGADHPAHALQLSAYAEAAYPNAVIVNRYVLLLGDDATYKLRKVATRHRDDFAAFLALLTVARWKEANQC